MKRKNRIKYPEIYQGKKGSRNYFEGWYFRQTSSDMRFSLIAIPGVSHEPDDPHAFIQIITGIPQKTYYIRFDLTDFNYSLSDFEFSIGKNQFSSKGIHLDINSGDLNLNADLIYGEFEKIDATLLSPNIMGFFAYFRFMECNHGVISMRHDVNGKVEYNGIIINMDGGRGYLEKDWGTSFPKKYIWMQSNHFGNDTEFFLSLARIPFIGMTFTGLISILSINGRQYRFATYNGSKFKIQKLDDSSVDIILTRGRYRLEIRSSTSKGHVLKAPRRGMMTDEITETLTAGVRLKLYNDGTLIHEDTGTNLGLEIVWDKE